MVIALSDRDCLVCIWFYYGSNINMKTKVKPVRLDHYIIYSGIYQDDFLSKNYIKNAEKYIKSLADSDRTIHEDMAYKKYLRNNHENN